MGAVEFLHDEYELSHSCFFYWNWINRHCCEFKC